MLTKFNVDILIVNDSTPESSEDFKLELNTPINCSIESGKGACTVTITDDDGASAASVSFQYASWSCNEADGTLTITLLMTGSPNGPVSVNYATSNGTATAGSDYNPASGMLMWQASESGVTKSFTIQIVNDTYPEPLESIVVTLSTPVNAVIQWDEFAYLWIADDDEVCPP
jgi:hypothetical protein